MAFSISIRRVLLAAALVLVVCAAPVLAATWDLATSFNGAENPKNGWTWAGYDNWYSWGMLNNVSEEDYTPAHITIRRNVVESWIVFPTMFKNHGTADVVIRDGVLVRAGKVVADSGAPTIYGGGLKRWSAPYWTAPATGNYKITCRFEGITQGQTPATVLVRRNAYANGWLNFEQYCGALIDSLGDTYSWSSNGTVALNAGDQVSAIVESDVQVDHWADTKGFVQLDVTISKDLDVVFNPFNGHHYARIDGTIKQDDARAAAAQLSWLGCTGHLVTITSETEQGLVARLVGDRGNYWLGGRQLPDSPEPAGGWTWLNGESFDGYTNWYEGQPNNQDGFDNATLMMPFTTYGNKWNDIHHWADLDGYIVEFDTPYSDAVVHDSVSGHYYARIDETITQDDARNQAATWSYQGVQGHLVSVTSAAEQAVVASLVGDRGNYWLGARQAPGSSEPAGGFEWFSGEPWNYTNWYEGQPNNQDGFDNATLMMPLTTYGNKWNDIHHWANLDGYIVEFDVAPPAPVEMSINDAKKQADNALVDCSGVVSAVYDGFFYLQQTDGASGLRVVKADFTARAGAPAQVIGAVKTLGTDERYIDATTVIMDESTTIDVHPVGLTGKTVGGSDFGQPSAGKGQVGVANGTGLNNIGLLVKVWGLATWLRSEGNYELYSLQDGSGTTVEALLPYNTDVNGQYLSVTGVCTCAKPSGEVLPRILLRNYEFGMH